MLIFAAMEQDNEQEQPEKKRRLIYKDGRKTPKKKKRGGVWVRPNHGIPKTTRTPEQYIVAIKRVCALYQTGQYTLQSCCKQVGIKWGVFMRVTCPSKDLAAIMLDGDPLPKGAIYECHIIYKDAKEKNGESYTALVLDEARKGLIKKVRGHDAEEITEEYEIDKDIYLDDGQRNPNFGKLKIVKQKIKRSRQAPDTQAIIFALSNVDKDNFKDTKSLKVENPVDLGRTSLEALSDEQLKRKKRELELQLSAGIEDIDYEEIGD